MPNRHYFRTLLGVYALNQAGVAQDTLFVIYEGVDASFTADPIGVDLGCQGMDPCLVFAKNLVLKSLPPVNNAKMTVDWYLSSVRTNEVKVAAKVLSKKEATQLNTDKAAFVFGITSPTVNQDKYLDQVLGILKKTPTKSLPIDLNKEVIT